MTEQKKPNGLMEKIKDGFSQFSQIISSLVLPQIAAGTDVVLNRIDNKIILIEQRIARRIISLLVLGLGCLLLIFSLVFLLKESLGWSNSLALFSTGLFIFIMGLLLKLREFE